MVKKWFIVALGVLLSHRFYRSGNGGNQSAV